MRPLGPTALICRRESNTALECAGNGRRPRASRPTPSIVLDTRPPCKFSRSRKYFLFMPESERCSHSSWSNATGFRHFATQSCAIFFNPEELSGKNTLANGERTTGPTARWFDEFDLTGDNREVASRSLWACGAAGSALPWHGRGHRFDPDQVHQLNQSFRSSLPPRPCRILSQIPKPLLEPASHRVSLFAALSLPALNSSVRILAAALAGECEMFSPDPRYPCH